MNIISIVTAIILAAILTATQFDKIEGLTSSAHTSNLSGEVVDMKTMVFTYKANVDTSDYTGLTTAGLATKGLDLEWSRGAVNATGDVTCAKLVNGSSVTTKTLNNLKDEAAATPALDTEVICLASVNAAITVAGDTGGSTYTVKVYTSDELEAAMKTRVESTFNKSKLAGTTATDTTVGDGAITVKFK